MTGDIIHLCMSALGNLPERKVLGEVDRFVDIYLIHDFEILNVESA
jgi:lipoprotein signal peptidase